MNDKEESKLKNKPSQNSFKQQQLKAWQPVLTPRPVIACFLCIGLIFLPIGIALLVGSSSVIEADRRYDNFAPCRPGFECVVELTIEERMPAPVFFYYRLTNFFQNHRRYVSSRSDAQLRGELLESRPTECNPAGGTDAPAGGEDIDGLFVPCGLIAQSFFNDTFQLFISGNSTPIPWTVEGTAWPSDLGTKFNNPPPEQRGIRVVSDFEDPQFVNWMRTAALPEFKKLYRRIDQDLEAGEYRVRIENAFPVDGLGVEKHVAISTTSWIGGRNDFLGSLYIIVSFFSLVLGIAFAIQNFFWPRKLGDPNFLDWADPTNN